MTIWLVEDETEIAEFLRGDLRAEGFHVELIDSMPSLKQVLGERRPSPDVVVLDRMLQQDDSLEIIPLLHSTHPGSRILILSAINTAVERSAGLNCGADDYLGKPFTTSELVARVRALLRRTATATAGGRLEFGNLMLDPDTRLVTVGEKRVSLPNKEFLILKCLLGKPGSIQNRHALFEKVWDNNSGFETNVVESTITSLRRRLEEAAANVKIKNMRNAGYWVET